MSLALTQERRQFRLSELQFRFRCLKICSPLHSFQLVSVEGKKMVNCIQILAGAPSNLIRPFGPVPSVRKIKLVVGADLSLSFVSEFLSGLMIGKAGEAFVVDR
jgi:hypothetical protein